MVSQPVEDTGPRKAPSKCCPIPIQTVASVFNSIQILIYSTPTDHIPNEDDDDPVFERILDSQPNCPLRFISKDEPPPLLFPTPGLVMTGINSPAIHQSAVKWAGSFSDSQLRDLILALRHVFRDPDRAGLAEGYRENTCNGLHLDEPLLHIFLMLHRLYLSGTTAAT